ncbi:flavin reductase family protein [Bradyrhizobium sp. WSM2793]|uniref:flavin reductase family protein n=1 Tax=Bradyrhizobium sp. WSM2793 TaxID=1038866 RepID=UPI0012FB8B25|nr:flavin reductase family protein [Bradyrhizobium sp. WSM2793]
MSASSFSADSSFRAVMRKLASSVVIITARSGGQKNGLTATAMCSLSMDPQSILVCVNKDASAAELILQSRCFAVNVLAQDQQEIASLFSTPKLAPEQRFCGASWHELKSGAPVLADALASLDCEVATHILYGTHYVFVGRVLAMQCRDGQGLLYCNGQYRRLEEPA